MKKESYREEKFPSLKSFIHLKKAQAWGFDLIFAIVIFIGVLVFLYLHIFNLSFDKQDTFNTLIYEGKIIGDSLLSDGFPEEWNSANVVSMGVLSGGEINITKIEKFYNLSLSDYQKTKILFNIAHDYYIFFDEPINIGGDLIEGIGIEPTGEENLVKVTRVVVLDKKIDNLNIYVWS